MDVLRCFCVYLWILTQCVSYTSQKYLEGHLLTADDWHFLARFCFLSQKGRMEFEFIFPMEDYEPQHILLYYDEPDQWPAVYKSDKNCYQREAVLNANPDNDQIIYLTLRYAAAMCVVNTSNPDAIQYVFRNTLTFQSGHERWWYVAISHCGGSHNCTQRISPPHIDPNGNQIIELSPASTDLNGCHYNERSGKMMIECHGTRTFNSARERWWFIAASRCIPKNNVLGIDLHYRLWLTNGEEEDIFYYHFSADEFYILQVDIAFLMLMFAMLIVSIVFAVMLKKKQLLHTTYKMYITSLTLSVLYLFFMCIAYGKYANDGLDNYGMKTFARVFEALALLVFLLMLILMAKGFTITRGKISTSGSIKIAVFMTLYTITYVVLFIYEAHLFDPGDVLYIYESPAGYGLVGMRLVGWLWFCYATFFTLKHYPEKSSFYYPFFIFYTIWFWSLCFWILLANFAIAKWVRETVVNGALLIITFLGYGFFLILTRPSAANKNFPFHIRTAQIGVMTHAPHQKEGSNPLADVNQSDQSRQGTVVENGAPNLLSLFTVSSVSNKQIKYAVEEGSINLGNGSRDTKG